MGKMYLTARPDAPGATPQWTTYAYDGTGRAISVTLPDGSVTRTEYWANTVKTIDAAGKWKKHTTNAFGNLVTVTEPNPAGGADWTTTYTYDLLNHLTLVQMPRPYNGGTHTQTRSFTYQGVQLGTGYAPSGRMTSETNPETGTVHQYDGNDRMTTRIDARNRKQEYSYDAYGRMTQKRYYNPTSPSTWDEDGDQRVDYRYDADPILPAFPQNAWGRLTAVEFKVPSSGNPETFSYHYSYNQAGRVIAQRMRIHPSQANLTEPATPVDLDASYAWDNEGRMTSLTPPSDGTVESYTYDAMGRLSSSGATYGPAGELLTFNGVNRAYNSLGQLTRMTKSGVMDIEYRYTAGANNGRISQSKDYITGEEVTYQYDALNRLSSAQTTDSAWGNAYTYDGWGNLTGKSVTKGTAPALSLSYDPALNMTVGSAPPSAPAAPWIYDGEHRPQVRPAEMWSNPWGGVPNGNVTYDHTGKKVFWVGSITESEQQLRGCEIYFYGITGKKLARYQCAYAPDETGHEDRHFYIWQVQRTRHVGGQLVSWNSAWPEWNSAGAVTTDRLGSIRARDAERYTYYPYGEVKTESVAGGGLYAGLESPVRGYDPGSGRFDRPDPLGLGAVKMGDPGSWNRFAYVQGDPVNFRDPAGLLRSTSEDEDETDWSGIIRASLYRGGAMGGQAGSSGGGAGPAAVNPLDFVKATTALQRQNAANAVANLGEGCTGVFNDPNRNVGTATLYQALQFNATDATYVDNFGPSAGLTLSQVGIVDSVSGKPYAGDPTVAAYTPASAVAVTGGGTTIILNASFYQQNAAGQATTLVHELLHLTFWGRVGRGHCR